MKHKSPIRHALLRLTAAVVLTLAVVGSAQAQNTNLTDYWAVQLPEGVSPEAVAARVGATYERPIGALDGYYIFTFDGSARSTAAPTTALTASSDVLWFEQQIEREIELRDPTDPLYPDQWHLENTGQYGGTAGADANVPPAWDMGYTGSGIKIGVVEGGVEGTHPDLAPNFDAANSLNLFGTYFDHGTSVAGVAAGSDDGSKCGVGAAYDATFTSLDFSGTDASEAAALTHELAAHDIYNNSWGPFDSGDILGAPGPMAQMAIEEGIQDGRDGKGVIYVWAAGNGRGSNDDVNADGYANSPYTIAVGASSNYGTYSSYSEYGSAMLINAPSNGGSAGVYTTDRTGDDGYNPFYDNGNPSDLDCTRSFGGTSSASPLAAGIIALMLEANPDLTWRDVQHILVETAVDNDPTDSGWTTNAAGYTVHDAYGHGRIDAEAAVTAAETWENVGDRVTSASPTYTVNQSIPDNGSVDVFATVTDDIILEHVEVTVNAPHTYRGDLAFYLTSPSGTTSRLLNARGGDSNIHFTDWRMMSTHFWGESAAGEWELTVVDTASADTGTLEDWQLTLHGTEPEVPEIVMTETDSTTDVTESGPAADRFDISLSMAPASGETVSLLPNYDGTQLFLSPSGTLEFDSTNWNEPVTVDVIALNDEAVEGSHTQEVSYSAQSDLADSPFEGIENSITANITDPATPDAGVVVTETGGSTDLEEGEVNDTVYVSLNAPPASGEMITISPTYDPSQVLVSTVLTFNSGDWNIPVEVSISAVDDDLIEGTHTTDLSFVASSDTTPSDYDGLQTTITATITEDAVLLNGSFEDVFSGEWTLLGASLGQFFLPGFATDGDYVALNQGGERLTGLTQQISTSGAMGDAITLNFDAGGRSVDGFVGVRITLLSGSTVVDVMTCLVPTGSGTYNTPSQTCTLASAAGAYDTIEIGLGGFRVDTGFFGFDNVSLAIE